MDKVYLFVFSLFQFVIKNLPKKLLFSVLNSLASLIYIVDKKHVKIAKVNLDIAYGDTKTQEEKNNIIKKCYRNLVFVLADFIQNQGATKEELLKKVNFVNDKVLLDAIKDNKKIIFFTAHYGNWELLSVSFAAKYQIPLSIVGRDLDSKVMNEILLKNREKFDIEILSKTGAMKGMIKAWKNNRSLGVLVDQNTKSSEGVLIDFFGKKARHTPSVAILAKKFDATIIPIFITTNKEFDYTVTLYEPIKINNSEDSEKDILDCVQAQADITQKIIEEKPEEWFWLHKRWKNQYEELYK